MVPGGANGDLLKSKLPNKYAQADKFGLTLELRSKFRVNSAWVTNLSHSRNGKSGSQVAKPAKKRFLKVRIARSAALRLCWCGGTSLYSISCSVRVALNFDQIDQRLIAAFRCL